MIKNHPIYYPLYEDKEKFIILITGGRGCERPTQEVIMADLTVKQIKDIKVGESVMGDDGTPRKVIDTMSGRSQMYCVHQTSAEDYFVNDAHILSVKKSRSAMEDKGNLTKAGTYRRPNGRYPQYPEYADIPISEFASRGKHFQANFRGYKANSIPYAEQEVKIEPYLLGLWLGDGTSIFTQITTPDIEIKDYLQEYAKTHNLLLTLNGVKGAAETLRLAKNGTYRNPLMTALRDYDLLHNKHIPQEYISNSERVRLELLAGLLDTDGHMERGGYEIIQKDERIARQIKFIADTLGFRTSINEKRAYIGDKDCGIYYRIFINGDTWRIPCRVERKKVHQSDVHKNKDWHLSQLNIEPIGEGDWCGICLDGNQRYLHSDGTVTHNSGKSFASSAFIERLTFELKKFINDDGEVEHITHNILYTRYTMTSAAISVIPEFMEKVEMDGLERYFAATKADVVNRMTGARIMFRGIKTSSGNQTAKLKSIHGITTFVVDEAEEWTSEQEFDTIMFSIRQKGIQNRIIIIMNPTDNNHFIYKKYIEKTHKEVLYDGVPVQISTHPNVLHIHTSYLDNIEHLSEQFIKEAQDMKLKDPDKYAHIFMGRWDDVKEGAIYKNWSIVNEFPAQCREVALGLDFGYGNAPTACVKCGVLNNCLYIDEQFYKVGMGLKELREELTKRNLTVYADSASPLLIQEIANEGLMVYPVDKSGLTVVAGIEKCKEFDHIYVTKRSYNVQHELRNYVWEKNKYGVYINQPVKENDHCFIGSTLIETSEGVRMLRDIREGDMVITSAGARRVMRFFDNGLKEVEHVRLTFDGATTEMVVTPDHKIKTTEGWKQVKDLHAGDVIYLAKCLTGKNITYTKANDTFLATTADCTSMCGSITTAKCLKAMTYTIRTKIRAIMTSLISNLLSGTNISLCTCKNDCKTRSLSSDCELISPKQAKRQKHGTVAQKAKNGIVCMADWLQRVLNRKSSHANTAGECSCQSQTDSTAFAPTTAKHAGVTTQDLTTRHANARVAERSLLLTSIARKTIARNVTTFIGQMAQDALSRNEQDGVMALSLEKIEVLSRSTEHVYDIEVEQMHEFIANGVVVHNCADGFRYYVTGCILGHVLPPLGGEVQKDLVVF